MSYTVAIVVDPTFGENILRLADRLHVWICSTPGNRAASTQYATAHPTYSLENGITTFTVGDHDSSEDMLLRVLPDVDLHHGEYSHVPLGTHLRSMGRW